MGSDLEHYPEEWPPHDVAVDGFWIDETPVTSERFRSFVEATGYVTVAERPIDPGDYPDVDPALLVPGSLVFTPTKGPTDLRVWQNWWRYVPGASWARPEGPGTSLKGRERHPVVHVTWEDVSAYASWAGKELPTEAEWEFAARGGLQGATYAWGTEFMPGNRRMANTWAGEFPWLNRKSAGERRTSPVRAYPANGYGLFDMIGNVWEWTADFYRADHEPTATGCCEGVTNPRVDTPEGSYDLTDVGGEHLPRKVIKGGSHLCSPSYCQRYRPAARQAQQVESSMSHIGFRCVIRPDRSEGA